MSQISGGAVSSGGAGTIEVARNGTLVSTRPRINFIQGANVTLTVTDDPGDDEVDVTIASSGGGGGGTGNSYFPGGW